MKRSYVGLLCLGHLVTDINQGALPALLPFLVNAQGLSFAAAAGIVFAANITSTIVQPVFGHAADKLSKPWILCLGMMMAGVGMGLTGIFNHYGVILALAAFSGIGVAAYHPQAARMVNLAAGVNKATAMSIFGIGGTMGFAFGPVLITSSVLRWDLAGSLVLMLPVTLVTGVMIMQYRGLAAIDNVSDTGAAASGKAPRPDQWGAFARLTVVVVGRSILFYGLNTFIPLYWIHVLHQSPAMGAAALTVMSISGIVGNLVGGKAADRFGLKRVILIAYGLLTVLVPVFAWAGTSWVALGLLIPIGFCVFASYSPMIVLGQYYLPTRIGFSSGITIGVAVAIGGGVAPILGKIADINGVWASIAMLGIVSPAMLLMSLTLPAAGPSTRS